MASVSRRCYAGAVGPGYIPMRRIKSAQPSPAKMPSAGGEEEEEVRKIEKESNARGRRMGDWPVSVQEKGVFGACAFVLGNTCPLGCVPQR